MTQDPALSTDFDGMPSMGPREIVTGLNGCVGLAEKNLRVESKPNDHGCIGRTHVATGGLRIIEIAAKLFRTRLRQRRNSEEHTKAGKCRLIQQVGGKDL